MRPSTRSAGSSRDFLSLSSPGDVLLPEGDGQYGHQPGHTTGSDQAEHVGT